MRQGLAGGDPRRRPRLARAGAGSSGAFPGSVAGRGRRGGVRRGGGVPAAAAGRLGGGSARRGGGCGCSGWAVRGSWCPGAEVGWVPWCAVRCWIRGRPGCRAWPGLVGPVRGGGLGRAGSGVPDRPAGGPGCGGRLGPGWRGPAPGVRSCARWCRPGPRVRWGVLRVGPGARCWPAGCLPAGWGGRCRGSSWRAPAAAARARAARPGWPGGAGAAGGARAVLGWPWCPGAWSRGPWRLAAAAAVPRGGLAGRPGGGLPGPAAGSSGPGSWGARGVRARARGGWAALPRQGPGGSRGPGAVTAGATVARGCAHRVAHAN